MSIVQVSITLRARMNCKVDKFIDKKKRIDRSVKKIIFPVRIYRLTRPQSIFASSLTSEE